MKKILLSLVKGVIKELLEKFKTEIISILIEENKHLDAETLQNVAKLIDSISCEDFIKNN